VAVGLHVTQFSVALEGQGHVGSAAVQTQNRKRDALAPLPTVGLYGAYQVTPRLSLGGRVDYLSLKVSDYDGRLINAEARPVVSRVQERRGRRDVPLCRL
jgi:hypothetical protein